MHPTAASSRRSGCVMRNGKTACRSRRRMSDSPGNRIRPRRLARWRAGPRIGSPTFRCSGYATSVSCTGTASAGTITRSAHMSCRATAWLPGSMTLSAYPGYVLGTPKLGRLEIQFFPTRAAALQALLRGDIDLAPWPVLEADLAKTLDRFADGTFFLDDSATTE